jgi:hypothetical protein
MTKQHNSNLLIFADFAELYYWAESVNSGPVSALIQGMLSPLQFTLLRGARTN